jgi:predicted house-cleaning noncanonical NTP pyrophosphatase (MazG superfamily)
MFTPKQKQKIAEQVQRILQELNDDELPKGEIHFILHVDGQSNWSWANIRNQKDKSFDVPDVLIRNITSI